MRPAATCHITALLLFVLFRKQKPPMYYIIIIIVIHSLQELLAEPKSLYLAQPPTWRGNIASGVCAESQDAAIESRQEQTT